MKLFVVSHPAVEPANQDFFATVERLSNWELTLLVPARWKSEYGAQVAMRWPGFRGELIPTTVGLRGNIPLHFYVARLRRLIAERNPDVVYVHHEPYAVATMQTLRAIRRTSIRFGIYSAQNLVKEFSWPVSQWERAVHARADFAFPVSDRVAEVLRVKGFGGRIEVLPLSVDASAFAKVSAPAREFTVGYVGRLSPEKGVDVLVRALGRTKAASTRLRIIGDGPMRAELEALTAELGLSARVDFVGYVPHASAPTAYQGLSLVAVPSLTTPGWTEQFGRVVIESLAAGIPVVTSDSGELPRLVADTDGGWTVPEADPDALAARLDAAVGSPSELQAAGERGRAAVARLYDKDAVADRFIEVVSDVGVSRAT
jgi:glycosyltransferase involved in cell wall biosynthesis